MFGSSEVGTQRKRREKKRKRNGEEESEEGSRREEKVENKFGLSVLSVAGQVKAAKAHVVKH